MSAFNQLVNAASETAAVAVMRAMRAGDMNPPNNVPAPPEDPGTTGNELDTGVPKPFQRMCFPAL